MDTNNFLTRAEPTLEQPIPGGLNPVEKAHTGAGHEELQPWERLMLEKFVDTVSQGRD